MLGGVSSSFTIVAKAGGSGEGAENTCSAIARALSALPPPWARLAIEVDVRLSADGKLLALHDATLERTTNGRGRVRGLALERLREVRAGAEQEPIPLLEEVSEQVGDHVLVVDAHDAEVAAAQALVRALQRLPLRARQRVIVASEHERVVQATRRLDAGLATAASPREAWRKLLLERVRLEHWAARGHTWMVPVRHRGIEVVTRRFAHSARRAGDEVWPYVVEGGGEAMRLQALGSSGCFTCCPQLLCRELPARAD
jgi:glycerophosphoryl diester phosphodiesterase